MTFYSLPEFALCDILSVLGDAESSLAAVSSCLETESQSFASPGTMMRRVRVGGRVHASA